MKVMPQSQLPKEPQAVLPTVPTPMTAAPVVVAPLTPSGPAQPVDSLQLVTASPAAVSAPLVATPTVAGTSEIVRLFTTTAAGLAPMTPGEIARSFSDDTPPASTEHAALDEVTASVLGSRVNMFGAANVLGTVAQNIPGKAPITQRQEAFVGMATAHLANMLVTKPATLASNPLVAAAIQTLITTTRGHFFPKPGSKKPVDEVVMPSPDMVAVEETLFSGARAFGLGGLDVATADIECLLQFVMLESMRESTTDLRDMLEEMKAINGKKKIERERISALKKDRADIEAKMNTELLALKASGEVPKDVTMEQYKAWRPLVVTSTGGCALQTPRPELPTSWTELPAPAATPNEPVDDTINLDVTAPPPSDVAHVTETYGLSDHDTRYFHAYYTKIMTPKPSSFDAALKELGIKAVADGGNAEDNNAKLYDAMVTLTMKYETIDYEAQAKVGLRGVTEVESKANLTAMQDVLTRVALLEALVGVNPSFGNELERLKNVEAPAIMKKTLSMGDQIALEKWKTAVAPEPGLKQDMKQLGGYLIECVGNKDAIDAQISKMIKYIRNDENFGASSSVRERTLVLDANGFGVSYVVRDHRGDDETKNVVTYAGKPGAKVSAVGQPAPGAPNQIWIHNDYSNGGFSPWQKPVQLTLGEPGPLGDALMKLLATPGVEGLTFDYGSKDGAVDQFSAAARALMNAAGPSMGYQGEGFNDDLSSTELVWSDGGLLTREWINSRAEGPSNRMMSGDVSVSAGDTLTFAQLDASIAEATNTYDSTSDLAQEAQLRLQMLNERRQQAASTVSNVMKKFADVQAGIIANMK